MTISAKVIADSVFCDSRLTTIQYRAPRCILAEINTHRVFSRNARSSRAVPTAKLIKEVENDPFIPVWTKNQPGMQGVTLTSGTDELTELWLDARDRTLEIVQKMLETSPHKQVVNRLLEPWMWVDGLISSTEWDNFFALRCHPDAEPHFQELAGRIKDAISISEPIKGNSDYWHRPYIQAEDMHYAENTAKYYPNVEAEVLNMISAARCARVSYRAFEGESGPESDYRKGLTMANARPIHASPFEHIATPALYDSEFRANYKDWCQYRHYVEHRC